ncbi:hypothetical protein HELRODRAFT_93198 [Helobdella robusta]|uniref:methylated diphthine methylhydrolase n=1 Tax=Helobdella robusta TaxID=6412 RepID=T1G8U3_HELRO|nr:hypothetical protein HELRODRAFT_93198 [Helobdella robusta]ESO12261.1 hypothetical protein HELRODRAFT_93198 [Helobdella robusta]
MISSQPLLVLDVDYPADSAEWCPFDNFHDILLCGNYQLQANEGSNESDTKRFGRVLLFEKSKSSFSLEIKDERNLCGVLDIKWSYKKLHNKLIFGVVDADGILSLWECVKTGQDAQMCPVKTSLCNFDDPCLALSLDWNNAIDYNNPEIVVSYSNGFLATHVCTETGMNILHQWKAHDYEAWICAFNYFNSNIIYSGGDDCKLKLWDKRCLKKAVVTSNRHSMGVCSIQSNFHKENVLATGSYDEHVLLWDGRNLKSPLDDTHVGGGVWRMKWEPSQGNYLATASMHNGCHVINYTDTSAADRPVCKYNNHQSLVYGIDWYKGASYNTKTLASCSFYDRSLQLWDFKIK